MAEIRKALQLPKVEYYETHLSIVNCILPEDSKMTRMETKVLANFMSLEGDIALNRFGPTAKKIVMSGLEISDAGLSNYLKQLKDKGCLKVLGDMITIHPLLQPEEHQQLYMFRLTKLNGHASTEQTSTTQVTS